MALLGHIVGRTGLACDPAKISAVRNWHAPDKVKAVRQFVGFVGYYRRFVNDYAGIVEPLVALTRKTAPFVWTDRQQAAFEALKACLISAPILGFPTEDGRFLLDTDASHFAVGGVLNQIQGDQEVVIAYASQSLRLFSDGTVQSVGKCWRRWICACRRWLSHMPAKAFAFSATVLYKASGNVGGGGYVHAFLVVSSGGSVHPSYGSQFPPVAAEVSKWRWDVGSLVHVVGPVLGYF